MADSLDVVSLRDYTERLFVEHHRQHEAEARALLRALDLARVNSERALVEAKVSINERLGKLNELRAEVIEDRGQFLRRDVFEAAIAQRDVKISTLENWRSKAIGVAAVLVIFSGLIGAAVARALG